jgi:hypothetical protein
VGQECVGVQSFECFPQHMPCYVSHVVGLHDQKFNYPLDQLCELHCILTR